MSALCTTFSTVSIWSVTDIIFCHFMPFFAFAPLLTPKIKIWKKCTKTPEILSFYTWAPLIKIAWCMAPEIWSATDRIFFVILGHFLPFHPPLNSPKNENIKIKLKKAWIYHHFTKVYQKSWSFAILFQRYGSLTDVIVSFILGYTSPFYPLNSPKNKNFKKMKKTPGAIII